MVFFSYLMLRFVALPRPWASWRDPTAFALAVGLSGAVVTQVLFLASDNFDADVRIFMIWLTIGTLQALCQQHRESLRVPAQAGVDVDLALPFDEDLPDDDPAAVSGANGRAVPPWRSVA
jgi:hypothetical protein